MLKFLVKFFHKGCSKLTFSSKVNPNNSLKYKKILNNKENRFFPYCDLVHNIMLYSPYQLTFYQCLKICLK